MAGKKTFEMKQVEAYRIAEADGFRQHPDVYWQQAETVAAPKKSKAKKPAAKKTSTKTLKADKLTLIEGIGPKIASLLNASGIETFAHLADAKMSVLTKILKDAGPRFSMHKPGTWPKQAKLARDGKMDALKTLQDKLDGGK